MMKKILLLIIIILPISPIVEDYEYYSEEQLCINVSGNQLTINNSGDFFSYRIKFIIITKEVNNWLYVYDLFWLVYKTEMIK